MTKSMHARAAGVKLDPRSVTLIRTLLDLEERLSAYSSEVGHFATLHTAGACHARCCSGHEAANRYRHQMSQLCC